MKRIFILGIFAVLTVILIACGNKTEDSSTQAKDGKSILRYNGDTGIVTIAELAEDLGYFKKVKLEYTGIAKGGPESIQLVASDQLEFGNAFNGAIIKSVEKGVKIKAVTAAYGSNEENYAGYFVKKNSSIKEAKDLIGKKVAINILGAHYEMVLKEYLHDEGLTEEEISKVELVTMPMVSSEQSVTSGQVDVATLNFLFRDKGLENKNLKVLFKDIDKNGSFTAGSYFFSEKYIKEHREELSDFTQGVAKAYEWLKENDRGEVVARMKVIMEKRERDEPIENLEYWESSNVDSKGGLLKKEDFDIWLDQLVRTGEFESKNIDTANLYTNEFNPYK